MIVVFDADVFESIYTDYNGVVAKGLKKNLLGVTNPSFELFLLLHYPNSVDELILTDQVNVIANNWVENRPNRRRYIEDIFRKKSGMRPKSNSAIGELAHDVLTAIEQEKKLNNNISTYKGTITSNIGYIIESIIRDQCN